MEREEVTLLVDQRLAEVKFDLREIGFGVKRLMAEVEEIRVIVIGRGGPETLMAMVHALTTAEASRREEEINLRKTRRHLFASALLVVFTALGGMLWAIVKALP